MKKKAFNFEDQRRSANAHIRDMKVVSPFIYPEWGRVQEATDALRAATKELKKAQDAWDNLGKD